MDIVFKNKTLMDKHTCREFQALTWSKNAGIFRWVLLGIGGISILYGVLQLVFEGPAAIGYAIGFFLMGCAAVFLGQWGYLFKVGQYTKRQQKLWGGPTLEKEVDFCDDVFVQQSKLGKLRFAYHDVTGLREGKTTVVILIGRGAMLVKKDGFADGTGEEFKTFMRGKIKNKKRKK